MAVAWGPHCLESLLSEPLQAAAVPSDLGVGPVLSLLCFLGVGVELGPAPEQGTLVGQLVKFE